MTKTIEAVYESGVLKPIGPMEGVAEHQRLRITYEAAPQPNPLAGWVGGMPDDEAAEVLRVIEDEFGKVDPNDWK